MFALKMARSFPLSYVSEKSAHELENAGFTALELSLARLDFDCDFDVLKAEVEEALRVLRSHHVEVLSVHLPFGKPWELSSTNDAIRLSARARYLELIRLMNFVSHRRYVLHPAFPGVPEAEREQRIQNACESIAEMAKVAYPKRIAVENMPLDVLGNTSGELVRMVEALRQGGADNVCVCCDMNHWLQEKPEDAVMALGGLIETTHVSDYDGVQEKHWLPGRGASDWNKILGALEAVGYQGPFLYECPHDLPCDEVAANFHQLFETYHSTKEE